MGGKRRRILTRKNNLRIITHLYLNLGIRSFLSILFQIKQKRGQKKKNEINLIRLDLRHFRNLIIFFKILSEFVQSSVRPCYTRLNTHYLNEISLFCINSIYRLCHFLHRSYGWKIVETARERDRERKTLIQNAFPLELMLIDIRFFPCET